MDQVRVGTKVQCGACGSEAVVTKAGEAELTCCGAPLAAVGGPGATQRPPS